jgi:hypothetical protein
MGAWLAWETVLVSTLPCVLSSKVLLLTVSARSKSDSMMISRSVHLSWLCKQELERQGDPSPQHLFVAANRAPSLSAAVHDVDPTRLSQVSEATED